jgi:hypothetical protein
MLAGNSKPNLSNPDAYVCLGEYLHTKPSKDGKDGSAKESRCAVYFLY